jgi:anti-sigma factor RsiW
MNGHQDQWLDAYLDGELTAAQQRQFETHLDACERCSEMLAQRRSLAALLQQAPAAEGLMPLERFMAEVGLRVADQAQVKPSAWQVARLYFLTDNALNLGWLAVPVVLLLASIFVRAVSALGTALAWVPGPHQALLTQAPAAPWAAEIILPVAWSSVMSGLGLFDLLNWNWITEVLVLGVIGILSLAWLAGWLIRTPGQALATSSSRQ